MNITPKISVTVPIYNTSKYLIDCLESLSKQSMQDIEFILVDDGSTDNSSEICEHYVAQDSRFKIIRQTNGGLASARQTGLNMASGEYIIVCDSDDWVEANMYERLYAEAKRTNADVVICGYFAEYADGTYEKRSVKFKEINGFVDNRDLILKRPGASWIKLIKRSLFEEGNIRYKKGINMGEDVFMMYQLMIEEPKIVQIEDCLYHYRRLLGENSYTNAPKMEHIKQLFYIYKWLQENEYYKNDEEILSNSIVNIVFAAFRTKDFDKLYIGDNLLTEVSWKILRKKKFNIKTVFVIMSKILPMSLSKKILNWLYPLVYK